MTASKEALAASQPTWRAYLHKVMPVTFGESHITILTNAFNLADENGTLPDSSLAAELEAMQAEGLTRSVERDNDYLIAWA